MRLYWTCSDFADKIRGTAKIPSGTSEEWEEWETIAKNNHPFRYWLVEELMDNLEI